MLAGMVTVIDGLMAKSDGDVAVSGVAVISVQSDIKTVNKQFQVVICNNDIYFTPPQQPLKTPCKTNQIQAPFFGTQNFSEPTFLPR